MSKTFRRMRQSDLIDLAVSNGKKRGMAAVFGNGPKSAKLATRHFCKVCGDHLERPTGRRVCDECERAGC